MEYDKIESNAPEKKPGKNDENKKLILEFSWNRQQTKYVINESFDVVVERGMLSIHH